MRRRLSYLGCLLALGLGSSANLAIAQTSPLSAAVRATLDAGIETQELRELREFEERTFGAAAATSPPAGPDISSTLDTSFLAGAALPDLPARWDDAVIQYLLYFRDDPRGQALMRAWYRRASRYDSSIREALRASSVPEDLRCVALAESGFDPTVRSPVGALGMWQFMPDTGAQYGLGRDRFVDERMDPERATRSAARYLRDLSRRFGSWELALAAYNMGYGSLLRAIRKFNTNDYATLSRLEAGLPFETTVYVSKIVACSIVMRNPDRFGLADVTRDAPLSSATISVPGGTQLSEIATLAGVRLDEITALNPQLLRGVVPPSRATFELRIPPAAKPVFEAAFARARTFSDRAATLRFGERPADFAARYGIDEATLRTRNQFATNDRIAGPIALSVPNVEARTERSNASNASRPTIALPARSALRAGHKRVYYSVLDGDELAELAEFFRVEAADIVRDNGLDARARLQSGQILQIVVATNRDLSNAVVRSEAEVRVVVAGSEEFFDFFETNRGRVRARYRVQSGDTLGTIAERFGLTLGDVARINRLPRNGVLRAGQDLIVYTSRDLLSNAPAAPIAAPLPESTLAP